MSFRVSNNQKPIYYYTVILDKDQYKESKNDGVVFKKKKVPETSSMKDVITFDSTKGAWVTKTIFKD